jgi:hypothetical protein
MNRRTFLKAASALAVSVVLPKELELLPIPENLEFKSVSMWLDGVNISNVQIFDFPLSTTQIQTLFDSYVNDSKWHHFAIVEGDVKEDFSIHGWIKDDKHT